jgi:hypothetical protein
MGKIPRQFRGFFFRHLPEMVKVAAKLSGKRGSVPRLIYGWLALV